MMKRSIAIMATMAITGIAMSDNAQAQTQEAEIIGKSTIKIEGGLLTKKKLSSKDLKSRIEGIESCKKLLH